ncbi:MAG: hypothetical protein JWN30_468 [Bacilli bacterium]|nr:hypothetical protein [Bacilli bacterium]
MPERYTLERSVKTHQPKKRRRSFVELQNEINQTVAIVSTEADKIIGMEVPGVTESVRKMREQLAALQSAALRVNLSRRRLGASSSPRNLTVKDVAEKFNVTEAAVYKWIRERKIDYIQPPVPGGKGFLIPSEQFKDRKPVRRQLDMDTLGKHHRKHIMKGATDIRMTDPDEFRRL